MSHWYADKYRRHLCDMHIDDWDEAFLSRFSPETYAENLEKAHINNAMLYLQSHVGLCYYPTKVGVMHKAFKGREDAMLRLVNLCHEKGISVTGYYSINYNTREHDRHPDWRMVNAKGVSRRELGDVPDESAMAFASKKAARYGLCCPNNMNYRAFVYAQIKEMLEYFPLDALFLDMPFWSHTCYCEKCRARWAQEVGGVMPVDPMEGSPEFTMIRQKQYDWMGEWTLAITREIKKLSPDMPVEFNFASAISGASGCGEEVCTASDYVGGDLYGGLLEQSFACKFYSAITKNPPFEYMFSRCKPSLRAHTMTKTPEEMMTAMAITAAHHGATLVIDAIDPVGTMDQRVYERVGQAFESIMPYEKWFQGSLKADIGIYYGIRSQFSQNNDGYHCKKSAVTLSHLLAQQHIPYGVTGSLMPLDCYDVIVAPMLSSLEAGDNGRLIDYVKNGGKMYISGAGNRKLVESLLNARFTGFTSCSEVYLAPTKKYESLFGWFNQDYPMPFDGAAPVLEGIEAEYVMATLTTPYTRHDEVRFASIHSNPPGIRTNTPMLVRKKVGKGEVIWSAVPLEANAIPEYQAFVLELLSMLRGQDYSVATDAPREVEMTRFEDEHGQTMHFVMIAEEGQSRNAAAFHVKADVTRKVNCVKRLPDETPLEYTECGGRIDITVPAFSIFTSCRIEY